MTRGVVSVPAPRSQVMAFKVSETERADIEATARSLGLSVSAYMRHAHELAMAAEEQRKRPRAKRRSQ